MAYDTPRAAYASLREFSPATRARHSVVAFWSSTHNRTRYARVFK